MFYTKGECLGHNCRFYNEKPDAICFKQGVLPRCSPELKEARKKLDKAAPDMYEALKYIIRELDKANIIKADSIFMAMPNEVLAKVEGN